MFLEKHQGCALNYCGSKARYWKETTQVLPRQENMEVLDLFTGGGSIATALPVSWSVTANDKQEQLVVLHKTLQQQLESTSIVDLVAFIRLYTHSWVGKETKGSKEQYEKLRNRYNELKLPLDLYALICSSFSNQIRFNSDGDFNLPKGDRYFNPSMENKLYHYLTRLKERDITFQSKDFRDFNLEDYNLVLCDPPYAYNGKSNAVYNESGGWQLKDLTDLLSKLDRYHEQGGKFVFFNEIVTKSIDNPVIQSWCNKYNVKVLRDTMTGCNYQRTNKRSVEVIVTNY